MQKLWPGNEHDRCVRGALVCVVSRDDVHARVHSLKYQWGQKQLAQIILKQ